MEIVSMFYGLVGSLVCHQLPARTIWINGTLLPMCARDTGIYSGVFVAVVYILLTGRSSADKPPNMRITIILFLLMLPMAFDGSTSYLGLRTTNNTIRLFSGLFFGIALPIFLMPAANYKIEGSNTREIIQSGKDVAVLAGAAALYGILLQKGFLLSWFFVASIIIFSFIFIIARVAYTVTVRVKADRILYRILLTAGITLSILGIFYLRSKLFIQPLKAVLPLK